MTRIQKVVILITAGPVFRPMTASDHNRLSPDAPGDPGLLMESRKAPEELRLPDPGAVYPFQLETN